jgi:hypothetical protein
MAPASPLLAPSLMAHGLQPAAGYTIELALNRGMINKMFN